MLLVVGSSLDTLLQWLIVSSLLLHHYQLNCTGRLVVRSLVTPFSGTSNKTSDSKLRGREGLLDELVELVVMVVFSCLGT